MNSNSILSYLHFSPPIFKQEIVLKGMQEFTSEDNQFDFIVLCGEACTEKTSSTEALIGYLNELDKPYKFSNTIGRTARILERKDKTTTYTLK